MLDVGTKAPDFKLFDQQNSEHKLSNYHGKWVVLYFYPKDNTPGCTTEACSIRDSWKDLRNKAIILGVSTDSVDSHNKFAQKYNLPFPLLADTAKEVVKAYGLWALSRVTFIINPDGVIAKVYDKVKPANHAQELLKDLAVLQI